ncbi:DUF3995 domain-containing protein [Euzebya tangerina]|uniref:DUF3995 domain-containing protein n=1 Tax=Euzebya tangerina TaxID=591198 RepID=UPI0013C302B7|nr:DUF3995 domain-containing protein [Euzebya tangerina]
MSATMFVLLAVAHSYLGERAVIQPLLAEAWTIPIPRWAANRLIRYAWHATSIAWLGLAVVAVGGRPVIAVGAVGAVSGIAMLALLRGHLAWPLFLLAAFAAGVETGVVGRAALTVMAGGGIVILLGAAAVHLYWVFGGTRWLDVVVPAGVDGAPAFTPGRLVTVGVVLLMVLQAAGIAGAATVDDPPLLLKTVVAAGGVVLALRAIGDGRQTGFTKTDRSTAFARYDDLLFTPLVVTLAFASLSGVLLAMG